MSVNYKETEGHWERDKARDGKKMREVKTASGYSCPMRSPLWCSITALLCRQNLKPHGACETGQEGEAEGPFLNFLLFSLEWWNFCVSCVSFSSIPAPQWQHFPLLFCPWMQHRLFPSTASADQPHKNIVYSHTLHQSSTEYWAWCSWRTFPTTVIPWFCVFRDASILLTTNNPWGFTEEGTQL